MAKRAPLQDHQSHPCPLRRCAASALALWVAATPQAAEAQTPVRIVIAFTEVRSGGGGGVPPVVNRTVGATLLGGNRIVDSDRRERGLGGGRGRGRGGPLETSNETVFRGGFDPTGRRPSSATWRVGANNTLVRTVEYGADVETIVVSLSGETACQANVTFQLKPGAPFFRRRGVPFNDIRAQNVSCRIGG